MNVFTFHNFGVVVINILAVLGKLYFCIKGVNHVLFHMHQR